MTSGLSAQVAVPAVLVGTVVDDDPSALYRLYDAGYRLLYVGVADDPGDRWSQHALTSSWWPDVAIKTLEWYPNRRAALDAETKAIAAESPVHNEKRPPAEAMTTRSWCMPKASADRLAGLVDDVHFATQLPKHLIMGAVVNVLDRHRAEIEAEARAAGGHAEK